MLELLDRCNYPIYQYISRSRINNESNQLYLYTAPIPNNMLDPTVGNAKNRIPCRASHAYDDVRREFQFQHDCII
jgi:hypothetical protein